MIPRTGTLLTLLFTLSTAVRATDSVPPPPWPLLPEEMLRVVQVADPQIAPGGDRVAFIAARFDEEHKRTAELWVVGADGQGLTRVSDPGVRAAAARWSPDGQRLAYLATGPGKEPRVLVWEGGEGSGPLSSHTAGARDLAWSPDGRRLAFLRRDPPSPEVAARRARGFDARVVGEAPEHVRLWLLDLAGDEARPLSAPDRTVWHFRFAPDGRRLALLSSASPIAEGHEYGSRLSVLDIAKGEERVLAEKTSPQATPSFSPDGAWVAYLAPLGRFKERGTLHLAPTAGGEPRVLLEDLPGSVWDVVWHPREMKLVAGLALGVGNVLATVSLEGEMQAQIPLLHTIIPYWVPSFTLSADGRRVAFSSETLDRPAEVWTAELAAGAEPRRLTDWNASFEELGLGAVEAVRWTNTRDDSTVEGVLVHPPGAREQDRLPLVVVLHGGPAYNWGLGAQVSSWAQLFATRGYRVLLPNFRGSSGYGWKWLTANVRDWGEGPMGDVMSGVDHLVARGLADPQALYLHGGSYGGYLAFWTVGHTNRFRAAFVRAGVADLASEYALTDEPSFLVGYFNATPYQDPDGYRGFSPLTHVHGITTPVLMIHGENDQRVPLSQSQLFYDAIRHHHGKAELVIYPREGHSVVEHAHQVDAMERCLAWFRAHP
jgi:dipeptidyl aminopeptidase/acylaminoacyl peptidase